MATNQWGTIGCRRICIVRNVLFSLDADERERSIYFCVASAPTKLCRESVVDVGSFDFIVANPRRPIVSATDL